MSERDVAMGIVPGRCYWCSNKADSVEDLFPRWLNGVLEIPSGWHQGPVHLRIERHGLPPKTRRVAKVATKVTGVKAVCQPCNNGWMSRLESAVKPTLTPMINGHQATLTGEEQLDIAQWACMKAGVYDGNPRRQVGGLTSSSTRTAIREGRLPIDMAVTLAAYEVALSFLFAAPFAIGTGTKQQPLAQSVTTVVLGHLIVQIVGRTGTVLPSVLEQAPQGIRDVRHFTIWPPQPGAVDWPPPTTVGEMELEAFCTEPVPSFTGQLCDTFADHGPPYQPCEHCGRDHGPLKRSLPTA